MIEIGGKPILWHIMKIYSAYGIQEFIICCGYKGYVIKEYFENYCLHQSDVTFDMTTNRMEVHHRHAEPWRVTVIDTGEATQTGGRLKRVASHLEGEEAFCFTYGDGVADIDIARLIAFHRDHGRKATVTAVHPPGRYGALDVRNKVVRRFVEKPRGENTLINGGFFVLSPSVIDEIEGDATVWECEPVQRLSGAGELMAYEHDGFWQPMDTLREMNQLQDLWVTGKAPWKVWQ